MDWGIIGTIAGLLAILGVAYALGKYAGKIDDLCRKKDEINAAIIKIDTLWRIYVEDNLIRHSNPGGPIVLPDELKTEIKTLLNNNDYLGKVKEPTLLVIAEVGIRKFSEIARSNNADLGQVLAEVNTWVFECLRTS
ncbi:hypothetical protein ES703_117114 [subsurface metagenome]